MSGFAMIFELSQIFFFVADRNKLGCFTLRTSTSWLRWLD